MPFYCIIETEDGWSIAEHRADETAEEVAHAAGGIVIDPGPYHHYDDANDALIALQQDSADDDEVSDLPETPTV